MNKFLTSLNQPLGVALYDVVGPDGQPVLNTTLSGLPLGTSDNSSTGEMGLKVIIIANRTGGAIAAGGTATAADPTYTEGSNSPLSMDLSGRLRVVADLEVSDIEIGQVELKDGDTTNVANIKAANTARTTGTLVLATQAIDAAGGVLSTTAIAASLVSILAKIIAAPATEAKQPALGTEGTPSSDVLTVINPRYSRFTDIASTAAASIKATAGRVFSCACNNGGVALGYLQLHNKASAPAAAEVPVYSFPVYPGQTTIIGTDFFGTAGQAFSSGIAFGWSTTRDTYTAATVADQSTVVHYL